ncbi:MAG: ferredoxin--NADP reductase [Bacteroidota bacterium]
MSAQFHKLKVAAIDKPIKDAASVTFILPGHLYKEFNFYPGQHLNIKFQIKGEEIRRSYSLNSCPHANEPLQITVKRVEGGLVSNFINDELKVGHELEVMVPQGRFYADIKKDDYKTFFLFAAGSGITPIISILKSVMIIAPYSAVNLFYGNKNQDTIIFKNELDELKNKYAGRLNIVHILSQPKVWTTWEQWKGKKGRIDTDSVEEFITANPPVAQSTAYFICGPGQMNLHVRKTLLELGIPKNLIHIEQFGGSADEIKTEIVPAEKAALIAHLNGNKHALNIPKGKTILQALKDNHIDPPYSCESGVCATCVAKVKNGKAEMKSCMALDDDEIKNGNILTCQALPTTAEIEIVFK